MNKYTLDNKIKYLSFSKSGNSLQRTNDIRILDDINSINFNEEDKHHGICIKIHIVLNEKSIILSQNNIVCSIYGWSLIEPLKINSIKINCNSDECGFNLLNKYKKPLFSRKLNKGINEFIFEYNINKENFNDKINKMEQQIEELNKFKNEVNEKHNELVNRLLDRIVELSGKN